MTRILPVLLAGALLSAAPLAPAFAQMTVRSSAGAQNLSLAQGKSAVIELPRDAAEVFVGNPDIANAIVRTPRRIFVIGQSNGQTSIYAIDKEGNRFLNLELRVGRDIGELRQILKTAMPKANIDVRTVNDTIILIGEVDSAIEAQKAADIAQAFVGTTAYGGGASSNSGSGTSVSFGGTQLVRGDVINSIVIRGRDQVMVKVTIAEVRRTVLKQFGVEASGGWSRATLGQPSNAMNMFTHTDPQALTLDSGGVNPLKGIISMLERNGVARVLAEPTVVATSGETAKFVAGGETQVAVSSNYSPPVRDGTTGITTTPGQCTVSYQLRKYGVSLNMTPVVQSEGRIQLRISTEVTEVDPAAGVRMACGGLPGIRSRVNETTLELPSGGSVVSAGLIQQRSQQIFAGQPGLMSLPILGALFRSREFQREDTELMIIMTPYIAKPTAPDKLARPDDGFVEPSDGQAIFLGRMNRLYATPSNAQNLQNLKGRVGFIND